MQLDIPLHLQDSGSEDCGPIGTLMILDYFGKTSDRAEVLAKVPRCNFGTSSFDNAQVLLDYGLKVELITAQPKLFDGDFIRSKPSVEAILERLEQKKVSEKDEERKKIIGSLMKFMDKGGKLNLEIINKDLVIDSLNDNKPVWVSMFANALESNGGGYHTVVITGHDKDRFFINNPWPESRKQSWENADEVIYAIHVSTLFDYDNGAVFLVSNK